jgi:glycosyltransferase involved in cell wall biosynthesis
LKLVIQIPCYNEEETLPVTIHDFPKSIPGIDTIEIQVINDGSTDRTVEVAERLGVHRVISFTSNHGLASAFKAGVDAALRAHADILVNTDADNQYVGEDIAKLVAPVVRGEADIVIGARPISSHPEFSWLKKLLQAIGTRVVKRVSKLDHIQDAASGFRAFSRNALFQINIYSLFSYTLETLIQAGQQNLKVISVPIRVNPKTRESRLFRGMTTYLTKSTATILSVYLLYRAKPLFLALSVISGFGCLAIFARYFYLTLFFGAPASSFWPSIIVGGALAVVSFQCLLTGILAILTSANRTLLQDILIRIKKKDFQD